MSDCQWGFQPGKSTVSALLSTTHDWLQLLEEGKDIGAVFLIFPFDQLGINPKWIHNYLADHKQCVVVNGVSSRPMSAVSGVPQGSILSPHLFLIYNDDIADVNLSVGSKIVLYADDILLYLPISLPEDLEHLQSDVDALQAYASANCLTFNAAKCKSMLVSRKKRHTHPNPSITLKWILSSINTYLQVSWSANII